MSVPLDLECFGGPQDGLRIRTLTCSMFSFDAVRKSTGEVTRDVYALEATEAGVFRLRFLSTQCEPIQR